MLNEGIKEQIIALAIQHRIETVILFGSRARGTNRERSDIDLAVRGGDFYGFSMDVEERVDTLLLFDVVNLDGTVSEELRREIERDGVKLYEKTQ